MTEQLDQNERLNEVVQELRTAKNSLSGLNLSRIDVQAYVDAMIAEHFPMLSMIIATIAEYEAHANALESEGKAIVKALAESGQDITGGSKVFSTRNTTTFTIADEQTALDFAIENPQLGLAKTILDAPAYKKAFKERKFELPEGTVTVSDVVTPVFYESNLWKEGNDGN